MKIIKLNESQFGRIFEGSVKSSIESGTYGENNYPELKGSEVTTQPTTDGKNGDIEPSNPTTTRDLQGPMGEQLPFGYGRY